MRLPDFLNDEEFNSLRRRIGAELAPPVSNSVIARSTLVNEIDHILSTKGVEIVSSNEISINRGDNTLIWTDPRSGATRRVIIYIRDVNNYGSRQYMPRFHFAECGKIDEMKRQGRFRRYVVATRDDGMFLVRIEGRESTIRLDVCQKCLSSIRWDGFSFRLSERNRRSLVSNFTLQRFFQRYPKSLIVQAPKHTAESAPVDDYSPDFSETSQNLRREKNWTCQACKMVFSVPSSRRFLHVHHMNGLKGDDSPSNLRVLCIRCHADQPGHGQMINMPDYREFRRLFPTT